jgi:hypothetical protein
MQLFDPTYATDGSVFRKTGTPLSVCARLKLGLKNAASAKHEVNPKIENEEDFTGSAFLKSSVLRLKSIGSAAYRANRACSRARPTELITLNSSLII